MADIRNDREREELHKAIWSIADDLRGSVDGWDFKQYVLGVMFYRYISENLTNYINEGEHAAGDAQFDYAKMKDSDAEGARAGLVQEKGFFILPSELFCNVRARATDDENLNETLERVFNNIEDSAKGSESEDDFAGLFDDLDVNSNKLGATVAKRNEKLVKLLNGVADMKLRYKDNTIDAFGDAYEYLMSMYASNAGKSGGEFFTPQEVSELLTRIAVVGKTEVNKVYDPACGSGSLLLKAARILGKENIRQGFFGQEINLTTYNLCRINMFLHDIGYDKFNIANEDTLISPQHWDDEPFEVIVSNPPYSIKWAGDENPLLINDPRFSPAGVLAPKSKADLAFIMHSLSWLATNGTAAIVCFPGIMYRGGAEKKIRKYLVDNNFIDCIIQLPSNLFYGTSIATCIMVLKKNKADSKILFIESDLNCQIMWALSLAIYVKAGRTPWTISGIQPDTAFAGIGYSILPGGGGNNIVIGCSHVYTSDGLGMKYKLSKLQDVTIDKKHNPYLSENEAYRLGLNIKELFYKSFTELPKRVVIHKRTPFRNDEIKGLVDSLSSAGIQDVELIEITYEDDLKCFALNYNCSDADAFPVLRGLCFPLNNNTMYLYTHGISPSVKAANRKYFQGGKSVPLPLKVIRHYGSSNMAQIANEILGLSRMNWNSFNLYSKLPCTIESSNQIAQIGWMLSQFEGSLYDYRFFM